MGTPSRSWPATLALKASQSAWATERSEAREFKADAAMGPMAAIRAAKTSAITTVDTPGKAFFLLLQ